MKYVAWPHGITGGITARKFVDYFSGSHEHESIYIKNDEPLKVVAIDRYGIGYVCEYDGGHVVVNKYDVRVEADEVPISFMGYIKMRAEERRANE